MAFGILNADSMTEHSPRLRAFRRLAENREARRPVYFEIAISLYTGFAHGLCSCTFGLYTARRVTGRVAFECAATAATRTQTLRRTRSTCLKASISVLQSWALEPLSASLLLACMRQTSMARFVSSIFGGNIGKWLSW
eukprot:6201983-Pleurochrysis_carterae.AAC.1